MGRHYLVCMMRWLTPLCASLLLNGCGLTADRASRAPEIYPSTTQLAKYHRVAVVSSARDLEIEVPAYADDDSILGATAAVSGGGNAGFAMAQGAAAATGALLVCIPCQLALLAALPVGIGVASAVQTAREKAQHQKAQELISASWMENELSRCFTQEVREAHIFQFIAVENGDAQPGEAIDARINLRIEKISLLRQGATGARAIYVKGSVLMADNRNGMVQWQAAETTQGPQTHPLDEWYGDDGTLTRRELAGAIDNLAHRFASTMSHAETD